MSKLIPCFLMLIVFTSGCNIAPPEEQISFSELCTSQIETEWLRTESDFSSRANLEEWRRTGFTLRYDLNSIRVQVLDRRNVCIAEVRSQSEEISQGDTRNVNQSTSWNNSPYPWVREAGLEYDKILNECEMDPRRYTAYMIDQRGFTESQVQKMISYSYSTDVSMCGIFAGVDGTSIIFISDEREYSLEIRGTEVFFGREI